jgi:hypothetical protein
MEIDGIQNRFVKPSGLRKLYEDQLRDLKRIADQMRMQRVRWNDLIHTSSPSPFLLFTSQKTENTHTEEDRENWNESNMVTRLTANKLLSACYLYTTG